MITRTFKVVEVKIAEVKVVNGKIQQEDKEPVKVTGSFSDDKLLKIAKEKLGLEKSANIVIINKTETENVYGVEEDVFLAHAVIVNRPASQQKKED